MTRLEQSKRHFLLWAVWKRAGGNAAENPEAAEVDAAILSLPTIVQATLREVYLQDGQMQDHARRLGCPEATISRRLGRADRLLADQLRARRELAHREAERVRMSAGLQ